MVLLHCAGGETDFPRVLAVLVSGILTLRLAGLERQARIYGAAVAVTFVVVAVICSSIGGGGAAVISILSSIYPRNKT
jgi:hypothetical protein